MSEILGTTASYLSVEAQPSCIDGNAAEACQATSSHVFVLTLKRHGQTLLTA